jgi:pimeloyl-ACP methyl ester carboxylesterase
LTARDAPSGPDLVGEHHGLAYARFEPPGERRGAIVILHGADSTKESHFEFARAARAWGFAAIAFDQRGHGATGGELDGRAIDDVVAIAALLRPGPVALRGSSMGGFMALAAASATGADSVVAICPASAEGLLRGLRAGRVAFRFAPTFEALLEAQDLAASASALGASLLLMHAEGDERVPIAHSEALAAAAPSAQFVRVAGGDHRSVQHDAELQGVSLRFVERAFAAPG